MDLKDLKDAKEFQEHFVKPLVDAVRAEVKPLVESDRLQSEEIATLKRNQGRALAGVAAWATALSIAIGLGLDWLRKKWFGS